MPASTRRSTPASRPAAPTDTPPSTSMVRHVWRWLRLIFVGRLRLKRRSGGSFDIVMESRLHARAAPDTRPARAGAEPEELRRMRADLRTVLDRHPAARSVLPHLAALERGLRHKGLAAFADFPAGVLRKALAQLEPLCGDAGVPGLALLRDRLIVAADEPPASVADAPSTLPVISDFHVGDRMEMSEVGVSVFLEAEQALARQSR